MFKVIETAGHDEPWWFFEDWEKMIVSTEKFDEIEDALCAYQALYQNFEDYCVPCECDLQIFHGIMIVDEKNQLVDLKGEERG